MIKLLFPIPKKITIAFSGGVDSVAAVDFLSRCHSVNCAFFHHNTENSELACNFVTEFCNKRNLQLTTGYLTNSKPAKKSWEEFWRDERYKFLEQFETVVTAHHLNDCVETYLWSACHGKPKLIPHIRNNVIRPFLITSKADLINWCVKKNISWLDDLSNLNTQYTRNYVRQNLMPLVKQINPGIEKVVKKLMIDYYKQSGSLHD